jgi:hypothetical protein
MLLQAKGERIFTAVTIMDDLRLAGRLQPTFECRAQVMVIFDN